jgi:hypothetical protein
LSGHDKPVPEIIQPVEVTFRAVATPGEPAKTLDPVEPEPANHMTSVIVLIVIVPALSALTKVSVVPIGYATEELSGIVNTLAVVSEEGW